MPRHVAEGRAAGVARRSARRNSSPVRARWPTAAFMALRAATPRSSAISTCSAATRSAAVAEAHHAVAGGRLRGVRHASAHDASPDVRTTSTLPPAGMLGDPAFRRGFAQLARTRPELRRLALSSADRRTGRTGARLSRYDDHPRPCRRPARHRSLRRAARRNLQELAQVDPRYRAGAKRGGEARRARHGGRRASASSWPRRRRIRRRWLRRGGPISKPASRRSASSAACSRAISRSTREAAPTRFCGTPSNG